MRQKYKPLKELTLADDFMFAAVMSHEDVAKRFLEALLGVGISRIQRVEQQKDETDSAVHHGVRLDVYIRDEANTVYNVEMQTTNRDSLERRARYYQSAIDRKLLDKNTPYKKLPNSMVIFVCTFDYFKKGIAVYKRVSFVDGCDIPYDDGSSVYFLNSTATNSIEGNDLNDFLRCVNGEMFEHDGAPTTMGERITDIVKEVRDDSRQEAIYVTYLSRMNEEWRDGHEEGLAEGLAEGRAEGRAEGATLKTYELVKNGDLKADAAARSNGMTLDAFNDGYNAWLERCGRES